VKGGFGRAAVRVLRSNFWPKLDQDYPLLLSLAAGEGAVEEYSDFRVNVSP